MEFQRGSGILLPVFSLPSARGIGTLGKSALAFIDFLKKAGQTYWQMLPLTPTECGDSPYSSYSSFAGNPYLIDLDLLVEEGLLRKEDVDSVVWEKDPAHVDYSIFKENHERMLRLAFAAAGDGIREKLDAFCRERGPWVENYALFKALKRYHNDVSWIEWEDRAIRRHEPDAVRYWREKLSDDVEFYMFEQYLFYSQWETVRTHAIARGIELIGDVPIYMTLDSADVWAEPHFFQLDEENIPTFVAGVPPDFFSKEGQLWGNPLYDWGAMERDGYGWWIRRIDHASKMYDVLRIDHFRALASYWAVPYGAKSAKEGRWVTGPGFKFVNVLTSWFAGTKFIAEDLGTLTPDVYDLMNATKLPGMKILEFAFDPVTPSSYLPHYYPLNCICYTGTHDNATLAGWYKDGDQKEVEQARKYTGLADLPERESADIFCKAVIRAGMSSVATLFIAQLQDYLALDNGARINVPGVAEGNWTWKMSGEMLTDELAEEIAAMTKLYGR